MILPKQHHWELPVTITHGGVSFGLMHELGGNLTDQTMDAVS